MNNNIAQDMDFKGTPEELGQDLIHRTVTGAYPMFGYNIDEVREGAALIRTKNPDDWARLWSGFGDRHNAAAQAAEGKGDFATAQAEYDAAYGWFSLARWPAPHTALRWAAYERSLEAFANYDRFNANPLRHVTIKVDGEEITALLRVPSGPGPFPLYVQISGLDGYKELIARMTTVELAKRGIATLTMDAPGTGQAAKITVEVWRTLKSMVDKVVAMPEIDARKVVLYGGSFGGFWATLLAYRMPETFAGVVVHGGPLGLAHLNFHGEYMFDGEVALTHAVKGARSYAEALELASGLDLSAPGRLDGPTPPMLLLNGVHDQIVSIDSLYRVLGSGTTPKEAWVNPQGVHMGRQAGAWTFGRIYAEIIMPWVMARMGGSGSFAQASEVP
ncbi:MAG: alpha/beta hydrolase [Mesorhizobium sp.]|nr:alpha/beta fold hydrolase [Mesorhizobium sp.]MCO5163678.1 alpha/beta hydrolase [Mesorhizobium sp.]